MIEIENNEILFDRYKVGYIKDNIYHLNTQFKPDHHGFVLPLDLIQEISNKNQRFVVLDTLLVEPIKYKIRIDDLISKTKGYFKFYKTFKIISLDVLNEYGTKVK